MPEVIDLLSSPINSPSKVKEKTARRARADLSSRGFLSIKSDVPKLSSFSDDLDFSCSQSKKRRRLTPPYPKSNKRKPLRSLSFLSSDDLADTFAPEDVSVSKTTVVATAAQGTELFSDPITFSSSAPESRTVSQAVPSAVIDLDSDAANGEEVFSFSQPSAPTRTYLSEQTAKLLANITGPEKASSKYKSTAHPVRSKTAAASAPTLRSKKRSVADDDIFTSSPPKPRRKLSKASAAGKEARDADKAAAKAEREKEKEAEKERRRLAKEEKAREKQLAADIADANKAKTDKKSSTPEMIVDMARSLEGTSIGNQVLEHMKIIGVETTFFDEQLDLHGSSVLPSQRGRLVRWRRKVKAKYSEEAGHWEPIPMEEIELEKHLLLHMTAQEFFKIAASGLLPNQEPAAREKVMTENLDIHVASLRSRQEDCKPIYLIEGLTTYLRKNQNAKNRAYTAAVRSHMANDDPSLPSTSSQPRRRKETTTTIHPSPDLSFITPDLTESLLLHLQLHAKILIHQSATATLSAAWIKSFTEHISTIPYRHVRMSANDAVGFCMDVGQVKTGDDRLDTYVKMLQEVQRVTPSMAYGIANEFGSVGELVRAFRREGPLVLQDIRKSANRDGAVSERCLGPAVSRRLYKVWMGRDEASTDGIS